MTIGRIGKNAMQKGALRLSYLAVGLIVGFTTGYFASSFRAVATSPMGLDLAKRTDPFERVFAEMTRLEEAEKVLGACKSTSVRLFHQSSLRIEAELIGSLRSDAKASDFGPPRDVAEAILELRRNDALPKSAGDSGREAFTVNKLLESSGWPEHSENALRSALAKMDESCK